jgi:hypothetical protein
MGEKQLVFYSITAVIIPMIELALNFDKIPKTGAAFPTPGTFERNHSLKRDFGSKGDKSILECDRWHISKEEFISRQYAAAVSKNTIIDEMCKGEITKSIKSSSFGILFT